jgi:molybdate transport system regulatory protein
MPVALPATRSQIARQSIHEHQCEHPQKRILLVFRGKPYIHSCTPLSRKAPDALLPRFRVMHNGEPALGPGKADLLSHINETGSIGDAAKRMDMSYMRAWKLIRTMNACFKSPLVVPQRGGKAGGGAALTPQGKRVLSLYRKLESQSAKATRQTWRKLQSTLKA